MSDEENYLLLFSNTAASTLGMGLRTVQKKDDSSAPEICKSKPVENPVFYDIRIRDFRLVSTCIPACLTNDELATRSSTSFKAKHTIPSFQACSTAGTCIRLYHSIDPGRYIDLDGRMV